MTIPLREQSGEPRLNTTPVVLSLGLGLAPTSQSRMDTSPSWLQLLDNMLFFILIVPIFYVQGCRSPGKSIRKQDLNMFLNKNKRILNGG